MATDKKSPERLGHTYCVFLLAHPARPLRALFVLREFYDKLVFTPEQVEASLALTDMVDR